MKNLPPIMTAAAVALATMLIASAPTIRGEGPAIRTDTGPTRADTDKRLPAFPGAEGFGAMSTGGRGGKVYVITTLQDYDPRTEKPIPGSFREAVDAEGPRMIVFAVSGNIDLKKTIVIQNPYITIAGQTSPGGICIRYCELNITRKAHDVVIRYVRWRPGDFYKQQWDGMSLSGCRNVIIDHCSVSWSNDEVLSATRDTDFLTVQWCMIAEALHQSYHAGGENHGLGTLIDSPHATFHHNLYAHNRSRNPRPGDALLDWRNNVIYNWDGKAGYTGNDNVLRMNYVGNYLKAGPTTQHDPDRAFSTGAETRIYIAGNVQHGYSEMTRDNRRMLWMNDDARLESRPFAVAPVATDSAEVAFEKVLAGAGATLPFRDPVDAQIAADVRDGTGQRIDTPSQVGGWPEMKSVAPPKDSDLDGMPDEWERAHGLNPGDPGDSAKTGENGYTQLENYINSLVR